MPEKQSVFIIPPRIEKIILSPTRTAEEQEDLGVWLEGQDHNDDAYAEYIALVRQRQMAMTRRRIPDASRQKA